MTGQTERSSSLLQMDPRWLSWTGHPKQLNHAPDFRNAITPVVVACLLGLFFAQCILFAKV
jgi:hypothetical protein